jgi:signal transduction histidine kinase
MHDKMNILMVDDQPSKLLTYEVMLNELGENLLKAHSASEALEHLLKMDVALILMDVSMPEVGGFELASMIRQHPRCQDTAIIFISAVHLTDADRLTGYEHGAVDYLSVPIVPELLRAKVKVFAELHRKTRQLAALNREMQDLSNGIIKVRDQEQRRIARELHDDLGQGLCAVKMVAELIQGASDLSVAKAKAFEMSNLIDDAIRQVRSVSHLLHPPLLDEIGLQPALTAYVEGLMNRSAIKTVIEVQPTDFPRLVPDLEIAIYRVVQEALTNVFRHSAAQSVRIALRAERDRVALTVRDDGKGIPKQVERFRSGSIGVGVSGMRQRIRECGGELKLQNANPGTLLEAIVPLKVVTDR